MSTFFGFVGLLGMLWFLLRGWRGLFRGWTVKDWKRVEGRIEEYREEERLEGADLYIAYRYEVDGVSHIGDRISPGTGRRVVSKEVEDYRERYPVGRTVDVYYNPEFPDQSYLQRDFRSSVIRDMVYAFAFGLLALFGFLSDLSVLTNGGE